MAYHILTSYFSGHSKPSCSKDILRQGSSPDWLSQLSRAMSKEADGTAAMSTNLAQLCVIPAKKAVLNTVHIITKIICGNNMYHNMLLNKRYLVGCNQ